MMVKYLALETAMILFLIFITGGKWTGDLPLQQQVFLQDEVL